MLPKFMRPFKMENQEVKLVNKRRKHVSSIESTTMDIGLRFFTQITNSSSKSNSNVVVKSAVRLKTNQTTPLEFFCFLKTCNLCNKQLSPDKDIYMYRGDEGFCSVECRNRQIVLDDMRELESSTKQMVACYNRQCCNDARRETRLILEDLRMQRLKSKPIPCNQNFWL
ncbi:hypothetical protein TanjilG_13923 [Lupinus angustifolius]|uniref:FLZ-type domain-containing protein n=1 Tax=Lupinus angustifolius TaxID=3871 RepID=A0A1J7HS22_LUPAN|nr:PREDICTED: uncharacterized protein LOC109356352 [Lupinus angustifolius]OIW04541.1 hypothetical protein TanjilG_13923 [Lupinus angustifolius]